MKVTKVVLGSLQTNCYIALEEQSGLGLVVDPAVCTDELLTAIESSGIKKLKYIILTHGHSDHIGGVPELKKHYPDALVVICADDEICLKSPVCSLADKLGADQESFNADMVVKDGDTFFFGPIEAKVVVTPGHTPGSACFLFGNVMFSGDTLFYRTCGRTDLFRGNITDMHESIIRLGKLKGDFLVYPGHGSSTTLDYERKTNRFMRKFEWSLL